MLVVFVMLLYCVQGTTADGTMPSNCRKLSTCDVTDHVTVASNVANSSLWVTRIPVVVSAIVPVTACSKGTCEPVVYRAADILGLGYGLSTLPSPARYCVEVELCDSSYSPITATRIVASYNLRDSCDRQYCEDEELCFTECSEDSGTTCKQHVAIIGPGSPREGKALADITSALQIPQLLYSTGSTFYDTKRSRYPYLHQMAPNYQLQVDKMIEIIQERGWRYVAILTTSQDIYGSIGYDLLKAAFDKLHQTDLGVELNTCLQFATKLITFKMEYSQLAAQLENLDERAKIVILWMEGRYADKVLDYFNRQAQQDRIFIASDGWSINTQIIKQYLPMLSDRYIGLFPKYGRGQQSSSLDGQLNAPMDGQVISDNIDLSDVDVKVLRGICVRMLDEGRCEEVVGLVKKTGINGYAEGVYSSLQVVYSALDTAEEGLSFRELRAHINRHIQGRPLNAGSILVYTLQNGLLQQATDSAKYPQGVVSTCSEPCKDHQYKRLDSKRPRCCYTCLDCNKKSIVVKKGTEYCAMCGDCERPTVNRTTCVPKQKDYFSFIKKGDVFSVTVFIISIIGMFCNLFVLVSLIRNSHTPIVKASSPELCYIMLISLMLLLCAPIIMVSGPGDITCPLQRYIIGLGTIIPIAVLFARTNRINVIFNRRSLLTSQLQKMVMSMQYNIVLVAGLALIQFGICLSLHVHHEQEHENSNQKLHVKVMCNTDVERNNFIMCNEHKMDYVYVWIGYVCLLILATTVVAYKTRRLPGNFNEARYICLVMFIVVVITISTICTYMVLDTKTNIMYQCWSIIVAVYAVLGLLFGYKIYVIYVTPEQNKRCDTNIALKKFIKQDSDRQSRTFSTLLIPTRHSDRDHRHTSVNSINNASLRDGKSSLKRPLKRNSSPLKCISLTISPTRLLSHSEHTNGDLSANEKRALFSEGKRMTVSDGDKVDQVVDHDVDQEVFNYEVDHDFVDDLVDVDYVPEVAEVAREHDGNVPKRDIRLDYESVRSSDRDSDSGSTVESDSESSSSTVDYEYESESVEDNAFIDKIIMSEIEKCFR